MEVMLPEDGGAIADVDVETVVDVAGLVGEAEEPFAFLFTPELIPIHKNKTPITVVVGVIIATIVHVYNPNTRYKLYLSRQRC